MSGTIIEQVPAGEPAAVAVPTSDEQLVAMLVDRARSEGLRLAGEGAAAATDQAGPGVRAGGRDHRLPRPREA